MKQIFNEELTDLAVSVSNANRSEVKIPSYVGCMASGSSDTDEALVIKLVQTLLEMRGTDITVTGIYESVSSDGKRFLSVCGA
jgi:hypothetical protein